MKLSEFHAQTAGLSDGAFVRHPATCEVYWGIVEPGHKSCHRLAEIGWLDGEDPDNSEKRFCTICHEWFPTGQFTGCKEIDPIPGSLADAAEQLRKVVAEKWQSDDVRKQVKRGARP